ncbi:MAG: phosphomethylpyrimidine synthase ThiC, partial [Planctomycetia bacterium]|nr:phosphomethylpyrimidine synthase ThiC [Planctomycetia bacterium]
MNKTQRTEALAGRITPEMEHVAAQEYLTPETIRTEVARGRLVIPANHVHLEKGLVPAGIGIACRTKINANLGNSPISSDMGCELAKVHCAIQHGADTVMDLSTGENIAEIRQKIIESISVPIGTVPIYQVVEELESIADMRPADFLRVIEEQARQGVDYMTVHCAILRDFLPMAARRTLGIVSRGGSLVAQWMTIHQQENPFYTHF